MTHRHAATIRINEVELVQALDLPDGITIRGIVGVPFNPRGVLEVVIEHDALPLVYEGSEPIQLTLGEIWNLVDSHTVPATEPDRDLKAGAS